MQRTKPPFRADQVGSFLRPAPLKDARAKREKGEITAAQLKAVEDAEIVVGVVEHLLHRAVSEQLPDRGEVDYRERIDDGRVRGGR